MSGVHESDKQKQDDHREHDDSEHDVTLVLHLFVFVLVGAFTRQVGLHFRFKSPALLLYLVGIIVGIYFYYIDGSNIFILNHSGNQVIRMAYSPAYFFLGTFNMQSEFILKRALPHMAACIVFWVTFTISVSFLCEFLSDGDGYEWTDYMVVGILMSHSDMKVAKHFMEASHSFSTREVFILLELECLIASAIASPVLDIYTNVDTSHGSALPYTIRTLFASCLAFVFGKIVTSTIKYMHHDNVYQTVSTFIAMFLSYAGAAGIGASGDLAVVFLALAYLGARPGFSPMTTNSINGFIEAYRYMLVAGIMVVGGILFTLSIPNSFVDSNIIKYVYIYILLLGSRFFVFFGFWIMFRNINELTFVAMLTVCTFNIKGIFSLVLTLTIIRNSDPFRPDCEHLFLLAQFQIFLSLILTKPIASLIFSYQDKKTVREKYSMVLNALTRINENKESAIKICRSSQFTADADWSTVHHTAEVEKAFWERFAGEWPGEQAFANAENESAADESRTRSDAIKDLLRLQKRLLEAQFRQGTLSGRSAKTLGHFIGRSMQMSSLLSSQQIIQNMGPYKMLQVIVRDLMNATLPKNKIKPLWMILISVLLMIDTFSNVYVTINKIFIFPEINNYAHIASDVYDVLMCMAGIASVFITGSKYLHTVSYSLWNWLAWVFTFSSVCAIGIEYFAYTTAPSANPHMRREIVLYFGVNIKVYYVIVLLSSSLMFLRTLILACLLFPVQSVLFNITSSMLRTSIYNQCDGCFGLLQVIMDTHKRLKTRKLDKNIEHGASHILHKECLSLRQFLGVMEIRTPDVMTALRTKVACRLVMISQEKIIDNLVEDGVLENKELELLTKVLRRKNQDINYFSTKLPEPSCFDMIGDIPWILMSDLPTYEVLDVATTHSRSPGDLLAVQGRKMTGLVLILKGLVRLEISIDPEIIKEQKTTRYVKERYFIQTKTSTEKIELSDFYSRGNVIGEFEMLIDKAEHKSFRCVTDVDVLFIAKPALHYLNNKTRKMKGPLCLLEYSMWTTVSIRQAARLILWNASHQLLTRYHIYTVMEYAYVLDYDEITDKMVEDIRKALVVLIYGEVICPVTQTHYHGPTILPGSLIDSFWRRRRGLYEKLQGNGNILLVIPHHKLSGKGAAQNSLEKVAMRDRCDSEMSLMTVSSGSSDGIPYRHYNYTSKHAMAASMTD